MEKFLWDYRYIIIILFVALVYALFNWSAVKKRAYQGMLRAKSLAKDLVLGSGQEQEDWVVENFWPLIPAPARLIISKDLFRAIIKKLYKAAKDLVDDGILNNSAENPENKSSPDE